MMPTRSVGGSDRRRGNGIGALLARPAAPDCRKPAAAGRNSVHRRPVREDCFRPKQEQAREQEVPPDPLGPFLRLVRRGCAGLGRRTGSRSSHGRGDNFRRVHRSQVGFLQVHVTGHDQRHIVLASRRPDLVKPLLLQLQDVRAFIIDGDPLSGRSNHDARKIAGFLRRGRARRLDHFANRAPRPWLLISTEVSDDAVDER